MCFNTPTPPEPLDPLAPVPQLDPADAARRREVMDKRRVTRDTFLIDPGTLDQDGDAGAGLKVGR